MDEKWRLTRIISGWLSYAGVLRKGSIKMKERKKGKKEINNNKRADVYVWVTIYNGQRRSCGFVLVKEHMSKLP